MRHTDELKMIFLESFLGILEKQYVGGAKNYMPVQFLVFFLVSNGNIPSLSVQNIRNIGAIYPEALMTVLGSKENVDTMDVPTLVPTKMDNMRQAWESMKVEDKEKITQIADFVKSKLGHA